MAAGGVYGYSQTAGSNTTIAGVSVAEGWPAENVNNSIRGMAADIAKYRDDTGGALTLAGGTTAYTLTTNSTVALTDGFRIHAVVNATNTGASTLAVDGLTAKAIRKNDDRALVAGDMLANAHMIFQYDASANGAAGAWLIVGYVPRVVVQVFTSDGTYTPTAGMRYCIVEAVGGGGGGGGAAASGAGNFNQGGGGGGGGYARKLLTAADIGASKAVDIGAKGTGGAAGNNNGTAGADTTLGTTLVVGKGGGLGSGAAAAASGAPGAGGVAGTGDVTAPGQGGMKGAAGSIVTVTIVLGDGGSSALGWGAGGRGAAGAGNAGSNYGAGGAGGFSGGASGAAAGGDGTDGVMVITEFL